MGNPWGRLKPIFPRGDGRSLLGTQSENGPGQNNPKRSFYLIRTKKLRFCPIDGRSPTILDGGNLSPFSPTDCPRRKQLTFSKLGDSKPIRGDISESGDSGKPSNGDGGRGRNPSPLSLSLKRGHNGNLYNLDSLDDSGDSFSRNPNFEQTGPDPIGDRTRDGGRGTPSPPLVHSTGGEGDRNSPLMRTTPRKIRFFLSENSP